MLRLVRSCATLGVDRCTSEPVLAGLVRFRVPGTGGTMSNELITLDGARHQREIERDDDPANRFRINANIPPAT